MTEMSQAIFEMRVAFLKAVLRRRGVRVRSEDVRVAAATRNDQEVCRHFVGIEARTNWWQKLFHPRGMTPAEQISINLPPRQLKEEASGL